MTISAFNMVRQAMGMMNGGPVGKISYEMSGKLSSSAFSAHRFKTRGDFELPTAATASDP